MAEVRNFATFLGGFNGFFDDFWLFYHFLMVKA
jgi:hypothetical protein